MTSPVGPAIRVSHRYSNTSKAGGVLLTLGTGTTLALEGGLVRGVARVETPTYSRRARTARDIQTAGAPIAYGYGEETNVFRTNLPVYETPRTWLTMAYCTSCLSGPTTSGT